MKRELEFLVREYNEIEVDYNLRIDENFRETDESADGDQPLPLSSEVIHSDYQEIPEIP